MIRDITIGQYYKADSVIHRLDPRVKLMGTLIFIISLFMGMNIWIYAVVTVALAVVIKMSRIPLKFMVRGLKSIVILIIISAVFNLFLTPGDVLIQIWKLSYIVCIICYHLTCSANSLSMDNPANDFFVVRPPFRQFARPPTRPSP